MANVHMQYLSKVVEMTAPPYLLKNAGVSVPPPKNDIRNGVFVIIIKYPSLCFVIYYLFRRNHFSIKRNNSLTTLYLSSLTLLLDSFPET